MGFKKFFLLIVLRVLLILLTVFVLINLAMLTSYYAASLILLLILIYQLFEVSNFVSRTNAELARFLEAARYADYSQRFDLNELGAGFGELGNTFTDILQKFQSIRSSQEEELKYLRAMVEHVPVPLISIQSDNTVSLLNNSARRLFGNHPVNKLSDLETLGGDLVEQITKTYPGERRLVQFEIDGMPQQMTISSTKVIIGSKQETLISLQDIRSELDAAQLQAWQDLVRVLTHEIMNSITPIASLAKTAEDLVSDMHDKIPQAPELSEELEDIESAVSTVARRSDGLMNFVSSYRQLTRLPAPNKALVKVEELVTNATSLVRETWAENLPDLTIAIEPSELEVSVDSTMIEQVLINIFKNAHQALKETTNPCISVSARLNKRGHVMIEIEDNGPGIPQEIINKVFVPFYTTKRDGSGVGLALTRQVMIAHGGQVKCDSRSGHGARFILTF